MWFLLIMPVIFMPDEPNGFTFIFGMFAIAIGLVWIRFGAWMARKISFVRPAPERLRAISEAASAKMDIKYREVLVVRCPMAQAVAFIGRRRLVFTDRLLELLSDDELAAICAHELAHLTESKWVRASRSIRFLTFWPWIFFKPIVHAFGTFGFFGLCLTTIFVPKIYRIDGCPVRVLRHPFRTLFKV
jgi:Zn-dependent protease with chaperone function